MALRGHIALPKRLIAQSLLVVPEAIGANPNRVASSQRPPSVRRWTLRTRVTWGTQLTPLKGWQSISRYVLPNI
jgi:hypothetical protein